jgi:hypothetical protein
MAFIVLPNAPFMTPFVVVNPDLKEVLFICECRYFPRYDKSNQEDSER